MEEVKGRNLTFEKAWLLAEKGDVLVAFWDGNFESVYRITKKSGEDIRYDDRHGAPYQNTLADSHQWAVLSKSKNVEVTCEGTTVEISRESAKALNLI